MDSVLERLGFLPTETRHNGNELWYNSPFREEKTPSFKVDVRKNLWYDFGESAGGTIIDLVIKLNRTDVKGALSFLESKFGGVRIQPKDHQTTDLFPTQKAANENPKLVIKAVKSFGSTYSGNALADYITQKRGIDRGVALQYLKEIHYTHIETGKQYFAAGLENTEGGYEVRNPYFKSAIPEQSKSISFLKTNEAGTRLICFEGFLDFLSYQTLFGHQEGSDYLILNSVSQIKEGLKVAQNPKYFNILTYFDNDEAGHKATQQFKEICPQTMPQNSVYSPHKDLNDYLMHTKTSQKSK